MAGGESPAADVLFVAVFLSCPVEANLFGMCRMFQRVDELKQQYTDKYVVVDDTQPELARFKGITGQVKTVNMSGRALVQFDAWANIGWYDIQSGVSDRHQ